MAGQQYGLLCPEGHGILIERDGWPGLAWCAHEEHGGNGRFYRSQEVKQGTFNPTAPRVKSEWQIEQEAKLAAREAARLEHKKMAEQKPTPEPKAPRERKVKEGLPCTCGCGGTTKGGRFLPGHDARYHSALAKAEAAKAAEAEKATGEAETF